jgi:hypothetical protein
VQRQFALQARDISIAAARSLLEIVKLTDDWESEEMTRLKKAIGITVGRLETDVLGEIYKHHPDLDDLA